MSCKTEKQRRCYDCANYFESYFCGYNECRCKVYGSLDIGQKERHPDTAAETCDKYETKQQKELEEKKKQYRKAKLIYCCGDCVYYSMKKHKCTRGAKDEGKAQDHFYKDCPLDDFETVVKGARR